MSRAARRCRRGTPAGSRALTCFWEAVPGPRRFRDRTTREALGKSTPPGPDPADGQPPAVELA